MPKSTIYNLLPYNNNIFLSKKKNSQKKNTINDTKKIIKRIVKKCNAVLVHECANFKNFSGRDVDTFYLSDDKFKNFSFNKNIIFHQREKGSFRFLINSNKTKNFINLDVEDLNFFLSSLKQINTVNFNKSFLCKNTKLKHFELDKIIFFKFIKYFSLGVLHSYEQLYKLKKIFNSISPKKQKNILFLCSKYLPNEYYFIEKLIKNKFQNFEKNFLVRRFWIKKRIKRQNKRKVFAGKLIFKNLFKSLKFIYAFLFGSFAIWPKNHKALPAITIIGNDGSGKTTICNYIVKNFSKMDPAHINMRSNMPILFFTSHCRIFLRKLISFKIIKMIYLLKFLFSFFGQFIDILDKLLRYKIGVAFADAGHGITIFERYITDKLRGEFPNGKNKFLPLEQFFPLPDGIIYLDVKPETSLKRKKDDGHTLKEMKSKRENYISLLKEFNEVKKITTNNKFENSINLIKNYIFELYYKKNKLIKSGKGVQRCIWKKNRKRILVGNSLNRTQKDSFL